MKIIKYTLLSLLGIWFFIFLINALLTKDLHYGYTVNFFGVYKDGKKIEEADPFTFEFISRTGCFYFQDKDNLFMGDEVITDHKPTSFKPFGECYATDGNLIYYKTKPLPEADPETFQKVSRPYARTQKNLAGPQYTEDPYFKDKNHVYYQGKIIPNAHAPSFDFNLGQYSDKKYIYYKGKIKKQIGGFSRPD